MDPWGTLAAGGTAALIFFIIWIAVLIGLAALGLWLTYTVIWRAVRRGLREYFDAPGTADLSTAEWTAPPTRLEKRVDKRTEKRRGRRPSPPIRPEAGPRDWSPTDGSLFD